MNKTARLSLVFSVVFIFLIIAPMVSDSLWAGIITEISYLSILSTFISFLTFPCY